MGSRQDTTNLSSLSVLVYGEKDDFGSKMLLVNQARLSGLVSVRQCGETLEQIVKIAASFKLCLMTNLQGRVGLTAETSFTKEKDSEGLQSNR